MNKPALRAALGGLALAFCLGTQAAEAPKLETLAALGQAAPAHRTLDIQRWTTQAGARVLFVQAHELPMFDLRLTFAAGSSQDGKAHGLGLLTNAMLNEGVAGKDVQAIAQGFEGLGADFGNGSYKDMAVATLRSLSDPAKRDPAVKLFSEVVGHPTFPADSLGRIKNQLLASFAFRTQNPGFLASQAFAQKLYGEHPYGHTSDGDADTLKAIDLAQLKAFHRRAYAAGNAVIALVGDLSLEQAKAIAEQVSNALPQGPALPLVSTPVAPAPGTTHIEFPSKQTHLLLGELGITRDAPDFAALTMGAQILGGGSFGTRLMTEVREKRGLTYGVYAGFTAMQASGPFTISLQTRAELSDGTLGLVKSILADYLQTGPTQQELDDAKRELAGSYPLSNASNAAIAGQLGAMGFYNLPSSLLEDFMQQSQALTVEQVREAMAKHLDVNKLVVVTVGPSVAQQPLPPPTDNPAEQPLGVPEH